MLWLNDNKLSKLKGLEDNFRLKHLYVHNNRIASLVNSSCCLKELRHLETLQLQGNMLQDLQATLKVLQKLTSLRQLNMQGNPLTNEQSYRAWVVYSLPWLDILDNFRVTQFEKVHTRTHAHTHMRTWYSSRPTGRRGLSRALPRRHLPSRSLASPRRRTRSSSSARPR